MIDFDEIDAGDYEFTFSVDDTSAEDTASVELSTTLAKANSTLTRRRSPSSRVTSSEINVELNGGGRLKGRSSSATMRTTTTRRTSPSMTSVTTARSRRLQQHVQLVTAPWMLDGRSGRLGRRLTTTRDQLHRCKPDARYRPARLGRLRQLRELPPRQTLGHARKTPDNDIGSLFLEERSTAETINTWTVSDNVASEITSADEPVDALNDARWRERHAVQHHCER